MVVDFGQGYIGFDLTDFFFNIFNGLAGIPRILFEPFDATLMDLYVIEKGVFVYLTSSANIDSRAVELFTGGRRRDVDNSLVLRAITTSLPTARDLVGKAVPAALGIGNLRHTLVAEHRPFDVFLYIEGHAAQALLAG